MICQSGSDRVRGEREREGAGAGEVEGELKILPDWEGGACE